MPKPDQYDCLPVIWADGGGDWDSGRAVIIGLMTLFKNLPGNSYRYTFCLQ
jgi:hypothetical protein